jgi:hypothetical protein
MTSLFCGLDHVKSSWQDPIFVCDWLNIFAIQTMDVLQLATAVFLEPAKKYSIYYIPICILYFFNLLRETLSLNSNMNFIFYFTWHIYPLIYLCGKMFVKPSFKV